MVVVLRDVYDLAHADIARELGISQTAAKVRLHRARRRLREQLFASGTAVQRRQASARSGRRAVGDGAARPRRRRAEWPRPASARTPSRRGGRDMQLRFDRSLLGAPRGFARQDPSQRAEVSCAEVARALPSILDGGSPAGEVVVEHVGGVPSLPGGARQVPQAAASAQPAARRPRSSRRPGRWPTCSARSSRQPSGASSARR